MNGMMNLPSYFTNVRACTDVDDVVMCGSCADEYVANMQDKIGNGYGYGYGYIN